MTLQTMLQEVIDFELDRTPEIPDFTCTADDVVECARGWFGPAFDATGANPRFIRATALRMMDEVMARGWIPSQRMMRRRARAERKARGAARRSRQAAA